MEIYKKFSPTDKSIKNKKHEVMFTGKIADSTGYGQCTNKTLEDLPRQELDKIASLLGL